MAGEMNREEEEMAGSDEPTVVKIIELIGSSKKSWEDATMNAVKQASKTVRNIKSVYLQGCTAKIENNKIVEYRSNVKISFVVDREM